jgi:hypothetical protein
MMRVTAVRPLEGYRISVTFTDGTERAIDVERYLRGPIFDRVRRDRSFFEAVTVDEDLGIVIWPNGADIDSDVLCGSEEPAWATER